MLTVQLPSVYLARGLPRDVVFGNTIALDRTVLPPNAVDTCASAARVSAAVFEAVQSMGTTTSYPRM